MSTLTATRLRTVAGRRRTLSLIAARAPLLNLPVEVILAILELAILDSKLTSLSLVSKAISDVIDLILYRTVTLDSPKTINLFHRTTTSKTPAFFASHVKRIIVTWTPDRLQTQLIDIITACAGLRVLTIPSCHRSINISPAVPMPENLTDLTIQSFDGDNDRPSLSSGMIIDRPMGLAKSLTHLRICEPGDTWYSPSSILASFGPLLALTHLQLSRRTNANEDNDIVFVENICDILCSQPGLKLLVVSIFPNHCHSAPLRESNIWNLLRTVQRRDRRVILLPGVYGGWKDGWGDTKALRSGKVPLDFWTAAKLMKDDNDGGLI